MTPIHLSFSRKSRTELSSHSIELNYGAYGASPYRPSYGESPPPRAPRAQDQACVLGPVHTNTEKNVGF